MMAIGSLTLAVETTTMHYVFTRLQSMNQWWHWMLLTVVCLAVLALVSLIYRRDSVDLRAGVSGTLLFLRIVALVGVLFFFFNLERRSERQIPKDSRVLMLIDTSQSMGLKDVAGAGSAAPSASRIAEIVRELAGGQMLQQLRRRHEVVVYRFDQSVKPTEIAAFAKLPSAGDRQQEQQSAETQIQSALDAARITAWVAAGLLGLALLALIAFFVSGARSTDDRMSWALLVALVSLIAAVVVFAVASLRDSRVGPLVVMGLRQPEAVAQTSTPTSDESTVEPAAVRWDAELLPHGIETRLGEAVTFLVEQERGGPVAGIIVVSDGGNNAGADPVQAIGAARDARIPLFAIGLGSDRQPSNVRLVDIDAPQRVYPGDKFTLTGYVQAFATDTRSLRVEMLSRPVKDGQSEEQNPFEFEEETRVDLGGEGEVVMVKFEARPTQEGRREYQLRLLAASQQQNPDDDQRVVRVEVVDRRSKVMLLAGGPSREFRFLRDQLFRDKEVSSTVLLQTATPGVSQEADELIFGFPDSAEQLFSYDCIVAFDPDWLKLDEQQISLLERWVADEAGGLVVIAGPVHTPQWANRREGTPLVSRLRALYPVVLYRPTSAALTLGRFGSEEAWPLQFTRDGIEAEFLWLEEDALGNEQAWASFPGVYGYYAVREPKPGAQVYSRFSDPSTSIDGELPIYMASHFYGAGRVFFQASGEMWRIREVDESYFEQYYTKLLRWVAQGRLLRDSTSGILIVDRDRCLLGDQVGVRAILTDQQHEPLTKPEVSAVLIQPDGTNLALTLRRLGDSARPGMYSGQFTALAEGDYRIELQTETVDAALLTQEVRVRVPQLEVEHPLRNDALLKDLTDRTGGAYYIGVDAALGRDGSGRMPMVNVIEAQDQVVFLPGTPDLDFEGQLMGWLMGLICGVLCLEWLIRRLSKLA